LHQRIVIELGVVRDDDDAVRLAAHGLLIGGLDFAVVDAPFRIYGSL